jgi:uncharacterized membrane protein
LETLVKILEQTPDPARRAVLIRQAELIQRANLRTVAEAADRADVTTRYRAVLASREPDVAAMTPKPVAR